MSRKFLIKHTPYGYGEFLADNTKIPQWTASFQSKFRDVYFKAGDVGCVLLKCIAALVITYGVLHTCHPELFKKDADNSKK